MNRAEIKWHLSQCEYQLKAALIAVENTRILLEKLDRLPITKDARNVPYRTKSGRKTKIENDPELEAFLIERIDTMSYPAMRDDVRRHFAKERHVSHSTIHSWHKRIKAQRAAFGS